MKAAKYLRACKLSTAGAKNLVKWHFGIPLKPKEIVFEVTDVCNSRCIHCNIWKNKPCNDPLKPHEVGELLKDTTFSNLEAILITGGEPTLRGDLLELMLEMHDVCPKANQWLSTNGLLPDYTLATVRELLSVGVNIGVGISLDGIGEKHDKTRGIKGNFDKVVKLIDGLQDLGVCPTVGFVLSPHTVSNYKELSQFTKERRIPLLIQAYEEAPYYRHQERIDTIGKGIFEIIQHLPQTLKTDLWLKLLQGKRHNFKCFAMNSFFLLHQNGDISPCLKLSDHAAGNVRSKPFSEIWKGEVASNLRKAIKTCDGCLNDWATNLSFESLYYPILFHNAKRRLKEL
jgi:MoaA/NifB/PqqE/SkfB family radical SAM enzyme